jgi:trk system potassium uptake protein TrkA
MRVLVAGAGNVGRYLGRILVRSGHDVTLIEQDEARLARAREESDATVVHGDATEPSVLEQSAIRGMDVVVAATGHDEDNLVIASLAKFEFGIARVVARVKNAMNAWLYEPDMGVDVLVSAPHTIAQLIEEQVAVGDVVQLLALAEGRAALVEATLPDSSPVVGSLVRDIAWPPDCVPAVVLRGPRVLPAPAEVVLQAGDRVLCVTDVAQMDPLHRLLGTTAASA